MGNPVREKSSSSRFDTGFVAVTELRCEPAGFVDFTTTNLPDGRILVVGGLNDPSNPASAVATAAIIEQHPRQRHDHGIHRGHGSRVPADGPPGRPMLCDGTVLVTGGTGNSAPAERYNPIQNGRR